MVYKFAALGAIISAALIGGPVAAQVPKAQQTANVAKIRTCLSSKADQTAARTCIGVVSRPCMDLPDGSTTVGMSSCTLEEENAWDVILNDNYKTAIAALDAPSKTALRNAQRLWIPSRDADCQAVYTINQGGTIRTIVAASCRLDATATRALWLADILSTQ